ncbi:sulfatase-like hydrolase/transferase [Niveispirillum fermenti]|uniref:sulfatase-like hydrolase/transferase n=1 Tax=Niveispirillum fermenti TaxID=1233113 RepID=UPI003A8B42BA
MTSWRTTRRAALRMGAAAAALMLTGSAPALSAAASPAVRQPNILFILVDDMGFADLSISGNRLVATPNIDALARDGMVMTQFYNAAPICSPSRAGFMTGQFPAANRFVTFIAHRRRNEQFGQAHWLDPQIPVLPRALKSVGYATGHFGKWHLGGGRDIGDAPLPSAYGIDESYTQFEGLGPRLLPNDLDGDLARQSAQLGQGPIDWAPRAEVTARFVDKTLDFVRRHRDGPWFAQLWLDDVHTPWKPNAEQIAAVKGKGKNEAEDRFLAVLVAMDAQIGRLMEGLRQAGALDNTLIVFTSDNGPTVGAQTPGSAGPYRGRKASLYEGGVRQPLIVRWPGQVKPGSWDATTVTQAVDLFPTLARIAGAAAPEGVDGIDIGRAWRGSPLMKRPDLYMHVARPAAEAQFGPLYSIRSGAWKLLMNADGSGMELYNIDDDPREQDDRVTQNADVTKRLSAKLSAWIAKLPTPGPAVGKAMQ